MKNIKEKFKNTIFNKTSLIKAKNWFLRLIQIQLVMSLVSLIVLVNWGLPFSILSIAGNLLFSPIFIVFLGLCSIIFFLEILYIPNGIFIYFLEKTINLWFFMAKDFNNKWLFGFAKPPVWFTIALPILILTILVYKKINSVNKSIIALALLFVISCAYLKMSCLNKSFVKNIECNGGQVTFIYDCGNTAIIDPGFIGKRISATSWIHYSLLPEIIKSCGSTCLDHFVIMQPSKLSFDAAKQLCKSVNVKNIYMPCWTGQMKKSFAKSYFCLKQEAAIRNVKINYIGQEHTSPPSSNKNTEQENKNQELQKMQNNKTSQIITQIIITKDTKISLEQLKQEISYYKVKYPAISLTCQAKSIYNETIKICSAKLILGEKNERNNASCSFDNCKPRISTNRIWHPKNDT